MSGDWKRPSIHSGHIYGAISDIVTYRANPDNTQNPQDIESYVRDRVKDFKIEDTQRKFVVDFLINITLFLSPAFTQNQILTIIEENITRFLENNQISLNIKQACIDGINAYMGRHIDEFQIQESRKVSEPQPKTSKVEKPEYGKVVIGKHRDHT